MKPDEPDRTASVRLTESTRVEAFSDAVMAIVITILVLELRVPKHEPGRLPEALVSMWGPVLAFLISFLRVSVIWLNHHGLFVRIRRVDRTLLWLNLGVLLVCTIVPLPTALLADALGSGDMGDLRVAAVLYAGIAALQSAVWIPIFPYLRDHPELVEPGTEVALLHAERIRPWIPVGIDVAAALLALISPAAMLVVWTLSLIFLAATSDGVEMIPGLPRWGSTRRERSRRDSAARLSN
jgi:TMEM175 potassium channel family protein